MRGEVDVYLDGQKRQLQAWVAQGVSNAEIARRVNVSASTVRYWREHNAVKRSAGKKPGKRRFKQTRPLRKK